MSPSDGREAPGGGGRRRSRAAASGLPGAA